MKPGCKSAGLFLSEPEFLELKNVRNFGNSYNSKKSGSDNITMLLSKKLSKTILPFTGFPVLITFGC